MVNIRSSCSTKAFIGVLGARSNVLGESVGGIEELAILHFMPSLESTFIRKANESEVVKRKKKL